MIASFSVRPIMWVMQKKRFRLYAGLLQRGEAGSGKEIFISTFISEFISESFLTVGVR